MRRLRQSLGDAGASHDASSQGERRANRVDSSHSPHPIDSVCLDMIQWYYDEQGTPICEEPPSAVCGVDARRTSRIHTRLSPGLQPTAVSSIRRTQETTPRRVPRDL